jgi:hypothetical protein
MLSPIGLSPHAAPIPFAVPFLARDAAVPTTLAAVATGLPIQINPPSPEPDSDVVALLSITMTPSAATIISQATATMAAADATATGAPGDTKPTECRLLGSFAILVQLALGGLALLSLVYKRYRERPQRPVKIWFFDVSKQVFGSVMVHVANVFMSMLTSGRFTIKVMPTVAAAEAARLLMGRSEEYVPNPCSFYLLNLAIDVSFCARCGLDDPG